MFINQTTRTQVTKEMSNTPSNDVTNHISDETLQEILATLITFSENIDLFTEEHLRDVFKSNGKKFDKTNEVNFLAGVIGTVAFKFISLEHAILLAHKVDFSKLSPGEHFETLWSLANNRIGATELFPILIDGGVNVAEIKAKRDVLYEITRQTGDVRNKYYEDDLKLVISLLATGRIVDFEEEKAVTVVQKLQEREIFVRDLCGKIGERYPDINLINPRQDRTSTQNTSVKNPNMQQTPSTSFAATSTRSFIQRFFQSCIQS